MGIDNSPTLLPPAPQRGEYQIAFAHLAIGEVCTRRNEVRRQPEVFSEQLTDRFADVFVHPRGLAVVPPLALSFAEGVPAPNNLSVKDEDQCRVPGIGSQVAIRAVHIG